MWAMRQSLLLLDFEDPSADPLKLMLLSCCAEPVYLKAVEVCVCVCVCVCV